MDSRQSIIVWNRATTSDPSGRLAKGDQALAAMLHAHGLTMNGGVLHAIDVMEQRQFEDAIAGYRFFGLAPAASLLVRARKLLHGSIDIKAQEAMLDSEEALLDSEYEGIIPNDSFLFSAFERHFIAHRADFAV